MKGGVIALSLVLILIGLVSADMFFTQQVESVYNLGETVSTPLTIKTLTDIGGAILQIDLICNGTALNFYKNGVSMRAGEEKTFDASLVLIRGIIGDSRGSCKIKATLNAEYILTSDFKLSNVLTVTGKTDKTEFGAGEDMIISGTATKETGGNSNGFVEIQLLTNSTENLTQMGTITDGDFSVTISLPKDLRAGNYLLNIIAYEKDSDGIITNSGSLQSIVYIKQVPTSLEIVFENESVSPGTDVKIKGVLHDQTGESINSTVFLTIKDVDDKIIEQKEIQTEQFLEHPIKNTQLPAEFKVYATSNELNAESTFEVIEKEGIDIKIINKTIIITNIGNVNYSKTVLVRVGDNPVNINVSLEIGESKKYAVSAPNGEYEVRVVSGEGEETSGVMSLTGNVVNVKEVSWNSFGILAAIILVIGLLIVILVILRKVYKKPFVRKKDMNFSFRKEGRTKEAKEIPVLGRNLMPETGNKAELSLSIKEGDKQDVSVVCVKVKNKGRDGSVIESINKVKDIVKDSKAVLYENQDYLFLILAPAKTKTFKNEQIALNTAERVLSILNEHNRKFNQKLDFGISINNGTIIGKFEGRIFKFMAMGNWITLSRKVASLAKEEILFTEKMNDLLRVRTRTEKSVRDGTSVFSLKEIKRENEEARKFIDRFVKRQRG